MVVEPPPPCPYCGSVAVLQPYPGGYRPQWVCSGEGCDARVGSHDSGKPLGTLANAHLRDRRRSLHAFFDPLWDGFAPSSLPRSRRRGLAYGWLAHRLGIALEDCHIAMFDEAQIDRALAIVTEPDLTWRKIVDGARREGL